MSAETLPRASQMTGSFRSYSICVTTYRRPGLLGDLLDSVAAQDWPVGNQRLQLVVVDNDAAGSARSTVDARQEGFPHEIEYIREPRLNISRAWNAAIKAARGDILVLVDDDQLLPRDFLGLMDAAWQESDDSVGAILSGVQARFDGPPPPAWLVKSRLYDLPVSNDRVVAGQDAWTGGCGVRRAVFEGQPEPFDPAFGLNGGEDNRFFQLAAARGWTFHASSRLVIVERFPPDRANLRHLLAATFRKGLTHARIAGLTQSRRDRATYLGRTLGAFTIATLLVPLAAPRGRAGLARALALWVRQVGKLVGVAGG